MPERQTESPCKSLVFNERDKPRLATWSGAQRPWLCHGDAGTLGNPLQLGHMASRSPGDTLEAAAEENGSSKACLVILFLCEKHALHRAGKIPSKILIVALPGWGCGAAVAGVCLPSVLQLPYRLLVAPSNLIRTGLRKRSEISERFGVTAYGRDRVTQSEPVW